MTINGVRLRTLFIVATLSLVRSHSAVITFDDVVIGQTSFTVDADGDGVDDVRFSTNDPFGFNIVGPGIQQTFIDEPGLEGTSILNPDVRIDFLHGARNWISFGFALHSSHADPFFFSSVRLFSHDNVLITAKTVPGAFTTLPNGRSSFPEGLFSANFSEIASYGLLDFQSENGRFIIDSFAGDFGSVDTPSPVPEPATVTLGGLSMLSLCILALRRPIRRLGLRRGAAHCARPEQQLCTPTDCVQS